jgi:hypothetical protein
MDPYKEVILQRGTDPQWEPVRRAMGVTRQLAQRLPLATMKPKGEIASTRYCLGDAGENYLIFVPGGGEVTVDLSGMKGKFHAEWIQPVDGKATAAAKVPAGKKQTLTPPFTGDAVVHLWK